MPPKSKTKKKNDNEQSVTFHLNTPGLPHISSQRSGPLPEISLPHLRSSPFPLPPLAVLPPIRRKPEKEVIRRFKMPGDNEETTLAIQNLTKHLNGLTSKLESTTNLLH